MRPIVADVIYNSNNSTLAVAVTTNGRLASLVKTCAIEDGTSDQMMTLEDGSVVWLKDVNRVWAFGEPSMWKDERGNERIDHHRRGVLCGSLEDGRRFLDLCRELGLSVANDLGFVPFSNQQRRSGDFLRDKKPFGDYEEAELAMARVDLPTREQLEAILLKAEGESTADDTDDPVTGW